MEYLFRLDSALIALCERFSHWFQCSFGRDNFWLSRMFLIFFLILWPALTEGLVNAVPGFLLTLFMVLTSQSRKEEIQRQALLGNKNRLAEPGSFFASLRLMAWALFVIELSFLTDHFPHVLAGYIGYLYFEACTPLPPSVSKVKQWLRSLFAVQAVSSVRNPT